MAEENQGNYEDWQHFLSSLEKSTSCSTPKKQGIFLGNIDCFSTNLIRGLLKNSGKNIKTELTTSSLKKLNTSAVGNDVKHDYTTVGPRSRSEDTDFSDEFEEGTQKAKSHMEDVSDFGKVEPDSISSEVLRKQTTKLIEPGTLEALSGEAQEEEMCEGEVSEKKSKVPQELKIRAVQRPGEKAASSCHPDKTHKLQANGRNQRAPPIEEKKAKVPTTLAAEDISKIKENIVTTRVRQTYENKNKGKKDVDTASSQWTLEMLSTYVNFKQSVGEIEEKEELEDFQKIIKRPVEQALKQIETVHKVVFAPHKSSIDHRHPETGSDDIPNLSDIRGKEAGVRILLDAILIPFAEEMHLNIETEKSYKNNNLPSCTFDYQIRYKNEVVGLVEAKSRLHGSGIGPDSVVQGILQLSALQAEVYGRMTRANPTSQQVDPLSLFNIISDGYQFIFIQLDQKKLLFDHQPGENGNGEKMPTIRCFVMDGREGIEKVLERLAKHLLEAIYRVDKEQEGENKEMKKWRK